MVSNGTECVNETEEGKERKAETVGNKPETGKGD